MLKIRLKRQGKRNDPFYRIILTEGSKKNATAAIADLGTWYPTKNKKSLDKAEINAWAAKGANISSAVKELMKS
ncbi:30S ribosomal protein S16 [Candidatus Woesebacteria bacterium GWB1_43_5]|uniref:30S ribosomal protein S16 n=1 Tax=Candidatus Woesebacteria bacterium GWB1_43_5 TaxID=1802474 RepID=A0A1F7WRI2_9BACT|nr:MAG: 30S ribosomal protein S16 [Candidatus Woesebacteria bacterium GWB1_43_5]